MAKSNASELFGEGTQNHSRNAPPRDNNTHKATMQFSERLVKLFLPFLFPSTSETTSINGHELTTFMLQNTSSKNHTVSTTMVGLEMVQQSRDALNVVLNSGATIYGVNTGFGGSAGARTTNHEQLQVALVQMLSSASYTANQVDLQTRPKTLAGVPDKRYSGTIDDTARNMPISWVRAAMLVRANTLLRGHSGVTEQAVTGLVHLLNAGITPVIPLIGSISASGDLTPLSLVVSTLQGVPSTMVWDHSDLSNIRMIPADEALEQVGLAPIICGPKEALAIVNGTAFSDAVGGLVINDAMLLAALAQILTAMVVEAMCGHVESFDPFIAEVKNDDQQAEIARNIRGFLKGSKLAIGLDVPYIDHAREKDAAVRGTIVDRAQNLAQDRYALRTSSQWLSPPVQDILSAFQQVQKCLNSTTDNPIVDGRDPNNPRIVNGGNFQGSTSAAAMDKTRSALQLIGKLMFAQCTEVINPATNNGLPANLAATDPSTDFACKGLDINIAAYCSELGWLAHPVGPHVQSAEMHNQAVNSLALISARKTSEAISILQKMMASCLYILCQALDVRVMQAQFFKAAKSSLSDLARTLRFDAKLEAHLWCNIQSSWEQSGTFDLLDRVDKAIASVSPVLLAYLLTQPHLDTENTNGALSLLSLDRAEQWQQAAKTVLSDRYAEVRATHFATYADETPKYLSTHTGAMYSFVRKHLRVAMFQGLADSPTRENGKNSIGGYVGIIETALQTRAFMEVLGKALRDVAGIEATFPGEDLEEREKAFVADSQLDLQSNLARPTKISRVSMD